jgi:Restriction endonuclease
MADKSTCLSFEKAVAQVQAQFDVDAKVAHNEQIVDRLGHSRQFDVVIRGKFGGQDILGVIECKDTKAKVGSPEVDAFVTKSQEVKANLRILMSRRGFTRPALEKCTHYGIQALSFLGHDPKNLRIFVGTQWVAECTSWARVAVILRFVEEPTEPIAFRVEDLRIGGKKIMDWFTNYLWQTNRSGKRWGGWSASASNLRRHR